jgi:murein L,D-transpeptidase YcbB/YkuD
LPVVQRRLGIPQSAAFDAATEQVLRAFQSKKGIDADGVINPRTFAYLSLSAPNSV